MEMEKALSPVSIIPMLKKKEDFDFQPQLLDLNFGFVPLFPSFYFQNLNYPSSTISVNIGKDTVLCRGQNVELGSAPQEGYTYLWYSPNGNLNNPEISNPILISPTNPKSTYDTITNHVTVYDSVCRQGMDTINVIYKPAAAGKINGSKSVCPGVDEISYWVEGDTIKNGNITWAVSGGELFEDFHDSVTVNWGETNLSAHVNATSINSYGCPDFIEPFAVKIFKLLETETPNGIDTLQCGIATQPYNIQGTNGSVYNWNVINGQIDQGNGTNQIFITWELNQMYGSVWIDESVNTELETCFGKSDTLHIVNPQAFLDENVHLFAISSDLDDATKFILHYKIQNPVFFKPESEVFWKPMTSPYWESSFIINNNENIYTHQLHKDIDDEYSFQMVTRNTCGMEVKSRINSNIFLTLQKDAINETLVLSWNKSSGWVDTELYEIYSMKDDEQFTLHDHVPGNTLQKTIFNTLDGFHFQYYIIGYSSTDSPVPSLSNKTAVSFEHIPFIPNVITPNGDNLNDCLVIDKLNLYPNNHMSIYNRYGEKVFEQLNYQNTWDGDGLPSGVYYYFLNLHRNSKTLKGWVHVMR
jgi:gliding motility-associated-like protein